jgi:hypothetical protein
MRLCISARDSEVELKRNAFTTHAPFNPITLFSAEGYRYLLGTRVGY